MTMVAEAIMRAKLAGLLKPILAIRGLAIQEPLQ
jgi:hypothetical protein